MARIVVTGGAGFLGSHLCRSLLARGDQVIAVDNLVTGAMSNIEELFGQRGFTFVEHDVSQYVWIPGAVDAVMHFASPASPADFERIPIQILKVGSLGTHNTLGLAKAKGATFFLASTSEVYGDPEVHPQPETYWGHVNPIGPRGVYDEAKRFAEAMTMAYHRHHGLDVRIVRIFNSILADEQVLYDDGTQLRRERVCDAAARPGNIEGWTVPAFDSSGKIEHRSTSALVGHPTKVQCFEVRTRYGRSVRVTGDHSLFVEGSDRRPVARPVRELAVGDRIAIAGRLEVPERDRETVSMTEVWDSRGGDPWKLQLTWPGLGDVVWERRRQSTLTLAEIRHLGVPIPWAEARVRQSTDGRSASMPAQVELTEELLWLLGLWVAHGSYDRSTNDAYLTISGDEMLLRKAKKVLERDLGVHVVRHAGSATRAASILMHSQLLLQLWDHLGFEGNRKRIPGWILGLPLSRLKWFLEGYREGDGVRSGRKFDGIRHKFSTVSEELKDDLIVALARFGICPSVGGYETTFKVSPFSPLDWDRGVEQRLRARRFGDIVWAAVKEIVPVKATPLVYDFSVPGFENFWAGTAVLARNTYGPQMRADDGRAVSNFLVQALRGDPITIFGDGSQTRSFCYVDDEVRGFLALLDGDITGPVNIGNPGEFTIRQLAEMVLEVTGSKSELVFQPLPVDDPTQRQPDLTLARSALGWEPQIPLRTGLERTAEYFRRVLGTSGSE